MTVIAHSSSLRERGKMSMGTNSLPMAPVEGAGKRYSDDSLRGPDGYVAYSSRRGDTAGIKAVLFGISVPLSLVRNHTRTCSETGEQVTWSAPAGISRDISDTSRHSCATMGV
jgi:hypothetical protein